VAVAETYRGSAHDAGTPGVSRRSSSAGYFITILDLAPLRNATGTVLVLEFIASKHQPVTDLSFSADGTSLIAVPKDGQVISVFQLWPGLRNPRLLMLPFSTPHAFVQPAAWAHHGCRRWGPYYAGSPSARRIVFAVNPYGGKPESRSHLERTVRNKVDPVSFLSSSLFCVGRMTVDSQLTFTELSSIARLPVRKLSTRLPPVVPLAFTFIPLPCRLFSVHLRPTSPHTRLASLPSGPSRSNPFRLATCSAHTRRTLLGKIQWLQTRKSLARSARFAELKNEKRKRPMGLQHATSSLG
jgi:hypothetical protein